VPSDYNYYNFKHAESKYKSNVDYAAATTLEYGQVNPIVKPTNPKEFVVETKFSVISRTNRRSGIITTTLFDDTPTIIATGETRYAELGELTVFYSHGATY
jgi:hypothetical protein